MSEKPTQLGRYQIEEHLGAGAHADVYRAADPLLKRMVALKVLKPALISDEDAFGRFTREAQVLAGLVHPRIAWVWDMGEADGSYFIAMRYVEGRSLEKVIAERRALSWDEALKAVQQVAEGLQFAHEKGLVHRDVKPQNIIISEKDGAVLTDFGLVRAIASSGMTNSGAILGTPYYMAPEVWEVEDPAPGADQYALACVLVEMLTGKVLFDGKTPPIVMAKHFKPLELPASLSENVPQGVEVVLRRALAHDPAERYASVKEFTLELVKTEVHKRRAAEEAARREAERIRLKEAVAAEELKRQKLEEAARLEAKRVQKAKAAEAEERKRQQIEEQARLEAEQKRQAELAAALERKRKEAEEQAKLEAEHARQLQAEIATEARSHRNSGMELDKNGDYDQAIDEYGRAIDLDSTEAEYYWLRGKSYHAIHDDDRAIVDYFRAIQLDTQNPAYFCDRGISYLIKQNYDRAIGDFSQAIKLDSAKPEYFRARGDCYRMRGDVKLAIQDQNKANELEQAQSGGNESIKPDSTGTQNTSEEAGKPGLFALVSGVVIFLILIAGLVSVFYSRVSPARQPESTPVLNVVPGTPVAASPTVMGDDGMVLLFVPAGEFRMGSDTGEPDDRPAHTVYLDAFWIDQTEVTNKQYAACVTSGGCTKPSNNSSSTHTSYYDNPQFDNHPVLYVNWDQAMAYCKWTGRRLPTEAEWEKAARGTDDRTFPWGENAPDVNLSNFNINIGDTTPVGNYPDGASPYGAMEMAGNVWEWVSDWYGETYYQTSPSSNPTGADSGDRRVLRGGSWGDGVDIVRSSNRTWDFPADADPYIGFRCARGTSP